MGNWYVVFVQTGSEKKACEFLSKLLDKKVSAAFVPQVEITYKSSKGPIKVLKPMFPGYVLIDSSSDERSFVCQTYKILRFSICIFKLLNNGIDYMKLAEEEKNFLLSFCVNKNEGYVAEESIGYIIGDKIIVTSGPLKGRESIIKKIDRHKRRAKIELDFIGETRLVDVALEIVSKI